MSTQIRNLIKTIDIKELDSTDKEELLRFFMVTQDPGIRNHLALIFYDFRYNEAAPFIIQKINEPELYNCNGTLVFALSDMDVSQYYLDIVKILCEQEYEARWGAFDILKIHALNISDTTRYDALKLLEQYEEILLTTGADNANNSTLHFIEETRALLTKLKTHH
ncbi:hypothetical protein EOD41_15655 [Mucilaginibacter limnophilus]|uniref:HEAT repeat domain-containing protein n=1 Tax=Mucilaginibacter limnophilus TaxID=1932778 RepID=A0A3S2V0J4_9SPHI|nr:hypothetical protein [Mucilaginibacter limnophilus]RVT99875.1 hypothetical protein EOD41_15655 [Mucilaginibacter limnophilus]